MKGKALQRLFVVYLVFLHAAVAYLGYEWILSHYISIPQVTVQPANDETFYPPPPRPAPTVTESANIATANTVQTATQSPGGLIIPVAGVRTEQLIDSFFDARSEGRVHDAIDIQAPLGTPVLAAADGTIVKFFDSKAGGTTIYQISANQKFFYYYAHLQARADDLKEGDVVKQGRTIGFVGDTGNAGAGNYHLHFSIAIAIDPKRYWEGTYINPYPYLKSGLAP